ncbi:MAG: LptF/LptG family permease [Planctomycetes bacterium]|nr:LptF/LptG family permease [Planctomycetota bacterium]
MLKLIDRQMVRGYFKAYLVCLSSLLSLYIVVDLFTNLDDFTHHSGGLRTTAQLIGIYYGYKVTQIFDRLCEAILLMAAMFTVAWMQRNNEQMPLLSAGVSTRRIVLPVIVSACAMLSLTLLNQELVIPTIGPRLNYQRDDPNGEKDMDVKGAYEPNGIQIVGKTASRREQVVRHFECTIPAELAGRLLHIAAADAHYVPPGNGPRTGGWELRNTQPAEIDPWDSAPLEQIDHGKFFLKVSKVTFDTLTRHQNSYLLASTFQIYQELQSADATRQGSPTLDRKKAVLFHTRLARPLLGMVLVFLGLSVILRDQNRNVFVSAGMCLVLCAVFFACTFICKYLGDSNFLSPPLAAWLPLLIFGPLAVVKFEAVHT